MNYSEQKVCCSSTQCPYFSAATVPIDAPRFRFQGAVVVGYLSGTIAHELRVFCYEGALHQSNGEYSFHCALKDHNLEMLRVINNLLSCMLNETCILLTSEWTKNKLRLMKKNIKKTNLCPDFRSEGHKQNECFSFFSQRHANILRVCVFFI